LDMLEARHLRRSGLRLDLIRVLGLLVACCVPLRKQVCQRTRVGSAYVLGRALFCALVQGHVLVTNRAKMHW